MPRLLLIIILAAFAGAAIWRRKEIRNDADRASRALAGAADSAKGRIRPDDATTDDRDERETAADDSRTDVDPNESSASTG